MPAIKPISIHDLTKSLSSVSALSRTLSKASTNFPLAVKVTSPVVETIDPIKKSSLSFLTSLMSPFAAALIAESSAPGCPFDSICRLIAPFIDSSLILRALTEVPLIVCLISPCAVSFTPPFSLLSALTCTLPARFLSPKIPPVTLTSMSPVAVCALSFKSSVR